MSEHENDDDGALSFLDLLTCGLIGMMVLAIILSVAMATGGASSTIAEELSPISQPSSARPRSPEQVSSDPLVGSARLYIVHDPQAGLTGWTSTLPKETILDGAQEFDRATHHVVHHKLQSGSASVVSVAVSISPGPSDPRAEGSSDMVAPWADQVDVVLNLATSFDWMELNAAELRRVGWSPVAEMIDPTRADDQSDHGHLAELLRRGGIISSYVQTLKELVPEACARLALLSEYESALGSQNNSQHVGMGRLKALRLFFETAANRPFNPENLQPFPLVVLEVQTNRARSLRFWIGRDPGDAKGQLKQLHQLKIVFEKFQTTAIWH